MCACACMCVCVSDLTSYLVEAFKGAVFRDVWVKVDQRVTGRTVLGSQTVQVDDVSETYQ